MKIQFSLVLCLTRAEHVCKDPTKGDKTANPDHDLANCTTTTTTTIKSPENGGGTDPVSLINYVFFITVFSAYMYVQL